MVVERVSLAPAFVLHGRAFRETSEIIEVLTRDHGRASLVARGSRQPRSRWRAVIQPFRPLDLSWSGRGGSLMTLTAAEPAGAPIHLPGAAVMTAFYANELLLRFLHRGDPHPRLFTAYEATLRSLAGGDHAEGALRSFEVCLLAESGYGLSLDHDAETGAPLEPQRLYQYVLERGPVPVAAVSEAAAVYSGADLLAIGRGDFTDPNRLAGARRLLRTVLDHHLGGRPLNTRRVYQAMRR